MITEQINFAKKYIFLLKILICFTTLMPKNFRPAFIFSLGRQLNPYNINSEKFIRSIELAIPGKNKRDIWNKWRDSHIQFLLDFLTYRKLDLLWLRTKVDCPNASALAALQQSGGLLLTYHTHHQNTMFCMLGLNGMKISVVAASPTDSPLFPYIGKWATKINTDSAVHFNGGKYIFTNNLRSLLDTTRECLLKGEVVVSLCDFHQPKAEVVPSGRLFERLISPPTGIIRIALKHQVPIFLAFFAPVKGRYFLNITQMTETNDIDFVVSQYFSFLESNIRANPACWQGWEWFEDLPKNLKAPL